MMQIAYAVPASERFLKRETNLDTYGAVPNLEVSLARKLSGWMPRPVSACISGTPARRHVGAPPLGLDSSRPS